MRTGTVYEETESTGVQRVDHHSQESACVPLKRENLALGVRRDEPLSRHSSLRVGGRAEYWAVPRSMEALRHVLDWAAGEGHPVHVVGLGSNVLYPDEGVEGVVVRLSGEFTEWSVASAGGEPGESGLARVGAGTVNAHLVRGLLEEGWVGAEFLRLIPGTFGGAVAMNAGTKDAELSGILRDADVLVRSEDGFALERRSRDELGLSYRHSEIGADEVVVRGRIELRRGDVDAAREKMERDRRRRDSTQPYKLASVGSTFANPEGDYAGRLIDEAGLKGASVGGATISPTHANFFINEGDATAEDVLRLMARARVQVREQFDIELRPEVEFVGFDGMARLKSIEQELC